MDERAASGELEQQLRSDLKAIVAAGPDPASRMASIEDRFAARSRSTVVRRRMLKGAAVAAGLAGAGVIWRQSTNGTQHGHVIAGPSTSSSTPGGVPSAGGSWNQIPVAPLAPRRGPAVVWAGDRLLVWGGRMDGGAPPDVATWDPGATAWSRVDDAPAGSAGPAFAVWDGSEVLVGMSEADSSTPWNNNVATSDAAYGLLAFDPAEGSWRHAAPLAFDSELRPSGVGSVVVLGDGRLLVGCRGAQPDGGRPTDLQMIDPATGTSEPVELGPYAATPYPDTSGEVVLAIAGDRVVAVPNWDRSPWVLDMSARTWRRLPAPPERQSLHLLEPTSIGSQLIVAESNGQDLWILDPTAPESDLWRAVPPNPFPVSRWRYQAVWTGSEVLVPGAAYNPSTDRWRPVEPPPRGPDRQRSPQSVWTGNALILFGGEEYTCPDNASCDRNLGPDNLDGWILVDP